MNETSTSTYPKWPGIVAIVALSVASATVFFLAGFAAGRLTGAHHGPPPAMMAEAGGPQFGPHPGSFEGPQGGPMGGPLRGANGGMQFGSHDGPPHMDEWMSRAPEKKADATTPESTTTPAAKK